MSLSEQFGDGSQLVGLLGRMISKDGLSDLLAGFNDAGEESNVESWVGSIPNRPTEAGGVERAIGRTRLTAMADELGSTPETVASALARIIPTAVDAITPGGQLPTGEQLDVLDLPSLLAGTDVGALLR